VLGRANRLKQRLDQATIDRFRCDLVVLDVRDMIKELIDNSLDSLEYVELPRISVRVCRNCTWLCVTDNGSGIEAGCSLVVAGSDLTLDRNRTSPNWAFSDALPRFDLSKTWKICPLSASGGKRFEACAVKAMSPYARLHCVVGRGRQHSQELVIILLYAAETLTEVCKELLCLLVSSRLRCD